LNWGITWTWLNLGNGFATHYTWIQWYEFTGALGGSAWVLAINIFLFKALNNLLLKQSTKRKILTDAIVGVLLIIIPISISNIMYYGYEEKRDHISVIVTQPNLDPYGEQYSLPPEQVVDINLKLAKSLMDGNPTIVAAPESTIQENIWEQNLDWSLTLKQIKKFIQENPETKIIIGASTYKRLNADEKLPNSARYHKGGKFYYEHYNTAFYLDSTENVQIHHKSKLTPGVEYMPSGGIFSFLENYAIDLGGTVGSLGVSKNPAPFTVDKNIKIAPIICYESIFGEYCTDFVKQGANLFIIITNDGWWGNTPGHRQHLLFTSLRAIETRRSIGRSANTGISSFTNQRGDISQPTKYWERDVIKQELNLNDKITFYARFGDYFGRVSAFLSVIFILLALVFGIRRKKGVI
jgi:apolipoprotein N-acyltransferase